MPRHDCHPLSNYCAFRLSASFWTESRDCTTARQGATTMVACSFSNRSACGCTSPQPGTSTPSTHHGWGDLRLVWENSCGEKRKWRRRAASIVLHFLYMRGMMADWRVNTVNASQPSTRAPSEHHWWVWPCSIWANSMIGMRKLSGCQCRNMWQLTGKESLASTWPMRIFTPLRPCRTTLHIIITQQSNSEEEYETEDDTTISGYYDSGWWWMMMTTIMMRWGYVNNGRWTTIHQWWKIATLGYVGNNSLTTTTSHHRRVNTTDSRIRMWV